MTIALVVIALLAVAGVVFALTYHKEVPHEVILGPKPEPPLIKRIIPSDPVAHATIAPLDEEREKYAYQEPDNGGGNLPSRA